MSSKHKRPQAKPPDTLTVDLGAYETPLAGFATGCAVAVNGDVFEFLFFEQGMSRTTTSVAHFYSLRLELQRFWHYSKDFFGLLDREAETARWTKVPIGSGVPEGLTLGGLTPPLCTAFPVGKSGPSALMECFYVNATSIYRSGQGKGKLRVIPVFGIQMHTVLLWSFLDHLKQLLGDEELREGTF